jgi:hypothetical protein
MLNVMARTAQFFLGEQAKIIVFIQNHDELFKYISRKYVPKAFGGEMIDTSGFASTI